MSIKDNLLPFSVDTSQTSLIEISSHKEEDTTSDYFYDPILEEILTSIYIHYPVYIFLESYSTELVEVELMSKKIQFDILNQNKSTTLYKINCNNFAECKSLFSLIYEAGTDSLFNIITMSEDAVSISGNEIKFNGRTKISTPALCFSDDLQGLFIIGDDKWGNTTFIKNEFLNESIIMDDINLHS